MSAPFPPFPLTLFPDGTWKPATPPIVLRDPMKQPGLEYNIWNLPLGKTASLTDPVLARATDMAMFVDVDLICLKPAAPPTVVLTNYDDWGAGSRQLPQGPPLFTAPIPPTWVVQGNHSGSPDGETPNASAAFLLADGHTIVQTQPFCRYLPGVPPTSHYMFPNEDLRGLMEGGSHGGSGLSAIGGTIRRGEWVPGGRIPHVIKLNLDSGNFYSGVPHGSPAGTGYRWPAPKSDGYIYPGGNPAVAQGSLLALPVDALISSLKTEEGRILAICLRDYGGYIVDSAGWSVYGVLVERSPDGAVRDEFQRAWGHPIDEGANTGSAYASDLHAIFQALRVVDSWDLPTWKRVAASKGAEGAGGGPPRVPWAAPLA